jgi:putative sigma-54 modulation protein
MEITITGQHIEVTPALHDYANEKIQKLEHYLDHIIKAHVVLTLENTRDEKKRNVAHADIHVKGKDLYAKAEAENMYAAIDDLSDKLIQQARKIKDKH